MGNAQGNNDETDRIGCGFCSNKRRVLHVSQFEEGQHICEPGVNKLTYKEMKHSLKAQYFHHAIIKKIKQKNDYQVTLVLIHYSEVRGLKRGSISIKEEERDLKYHEIYIVEYTYQKYFSQEIVERAIKEAREAEKETEKEANTEAQIEKEKETNRKTEKETELEAKTEVVNETKEVNREPEKEENKEALTEKEANKETEKDPEKEANTKTIIETEKEANRQKEKETEKEVNKKSLTDTEKEANRKTVTEAGKIASNDRENEIENGANREAKPKLEKETGKESNRETEMETEKEAKTDENEDENEVFQNTFGDYNLFVSNCEHFATWCVLGNKESFQIYEKWRLYLFPLKISSGMAGILSQLLLEILRLFAFLITEADLYGPGFALFIIGAMYLLLLFVRYLLLYYRYQYYRRICQNCYEEQKRTLAFKLVWFIISGTLMYFITEASMPWFPAWPVTILLHVIFANLSLLFRWVNNRLKSPLRCLSTRVEKMSQIEKGDIITVRHFGFQHFALITEKHPDSNEISIISYKGIFFFNRLKEYKISWSENSIWQQKLPQSTYMYEANQRISRMKSRLNEMKWHWLYNRSVHVCYWATIQKEHWKYYPPVHKNETVNQIAEHNNGKKSSLVVESIIVNLREEIEVGDMVEFHIKSKSSKKGRGIIIEIKDLDESNVRNDRIFVLCLVTQTHKTITESNETVDLNIDTVRAKKYHPVHCFSMEERKNRANYAKENKQQSHRFKLVDFCVLKENNTYFEVSDFEKKEN